MVLSGPAETGNGIDVTGNYTASVSPFSSMAPKTITEVLSKPPSFISSFPKPAAVAGWTWERSVSEATLPWPQRTAAPFLRKFHRPIPGDALKLQGQGAAVCNGRRFNRRRRPPKETARI